MNSSNIHAFPAVNTREEAMLMASQGIVMTMSTNSPSIEMSHLALLSEDGVTEANWYLERVSTHVVRLTPFIPVAGSYNFTVMIGAHIMEGVLLVTIQPDTDSAEWDFWGSGLMGGTVGEEMVVYARKRDKFSNYM